MDNRSSSHSMEMPVSYSFYSKVLYGKLREDVREILSTLCKYKDVDIITNVVFVDYVHLIVVLPQHKFPPLRNKIGRASCRERV